MAYSSAGAPFDFGTHTVDGDVLTVSTEPESVNCGGAESVYALELTSDDEFSLTTVSEGCMVRQRYNSAPHTRQAPYRRWKRCVPALTWSRKPAILVQLPLPAYR